MMIVGFGEFIDVSDGQQSLFARVRTGSGHEFDLPLVPAQLEILKTQLQAEGGVEAAVPVSPAAPQAVKVATVPPPQLLRKTSNNPWGDDDDEPEGFQLAHSVEEG